MPALKGNKYAIGNRGGRPSKFNDGTLKRARAYLKSCKDKLKTDGAGKSLIQVNLPKAEGLARHLGVRRETLYAWARESEEFSNILEAINQEQVERLINSGLAGTYNPTIAKLVLAKHGYKDSSETDITSGGNKIEFGWEK